MPYNEKTTRSGLHSETSEQMLRDLVQEYAAHQIETLVMLAVGIDGVVHAVISSHRPEATLGLLSWAEHRILNNSFEADGS